MILASSSSLRAPVPDRNPRLRLQQLLFYPELHAVQVLHVQADELFRHGSVLAIEFLVRDNARHQLFVHRRAVRSGGGLQPNRVLLETGADHGELARGLGGAVGIGRGVVCRPYHVGREDDTGNGEDGGADEDAPADLVRHGASARVLLRGDDAVIVEVAFERNAQQQQDEHGGERDKDHVDAELVQCAQREPQVHGGDAVARGAQRRHQRGRHGDAGDERSRLLVARVAQASCEAAHQRQDEVPYRGARVVRHSLRHAGDGGEIEVERRGDEAEDHLDDEPRGGVARQGAVQRSRGVRDGEYRTHEGADKHGAHDGDVGVGVQAYACDNHGDDEDAQVVAIEARPVDKTLADHMVGRAAFADVEGVPEKGEDPPGDALEHGALAMAPAMAVDIFLWVYRAALGATLVIALVRQGFHLPFTSCTERMRRAGRRARVRLA